MVITSKRGHLERDPATAKMGQEILPFELGYLPEYFVRKAEVELNETPERKVQGLRQIKELAKRDKHTKNIVFDDDFLTQYLRVRKYDVARAFSTLKAYVILRKKNPNLFTNFRFESIVKTVTDRCVTILPYRCQDGCTILFIELDNWDPENFPVEEVRRAFVIYLLQSLREPMSQVNGIKAIIDVKSNPVKHLKHCTPTNLYLIYHGIQECCPMRYKSVHVVNDSLVFKAAWIIIKTFLSEKIKKRIHFHSSPKELLDHFPKAVLPKHYGGDLENYQTLDWLKRVMTPEKLATIGGFQLQET